MYNLKRTIRTITKAPKLGVFTAIGAVIALTMLLAACPEEAPTGPTGPTGPSAPTNLVVEISDSQAELTWDAVAGATEYRIYRAGPDGVLARIASNITITNTTFTDTGLENGTQYRYVVRAVTSAGESGDSDGVIATPVLAAPAAPANLSATAGDAQVTLSWDAVGNAETYQVYRADTANGTLARIADSTTITETSHIDTGLTNGTAYRYTVRAANAAGVSPDSSETSATPLPPILVAPANLSGTPSSPAGNIQISLSWDAVAGAAEYQIYRAATPGGTLTRVDEDTTITAATYTDTVLISGTAYRYTVRAVNIAGVSPDSNEISITAPTPPAVPANLSGTASASEGIINTALSWAAATGAAEYRIYRAIADGAPTRIASSDTITATAYTDTRLMRGTTYRYTVRAVNADGESADSSEEIVATPAIPAAPENFSATGGSGQITLSWDTATGATEYQIYRALEGAFITFSRIASSATVTTTFHADTGLTGGTGYRYFVRAVNSNGESLASDVVRATVPATLAAPANLAAAAANTEVLLSWDAVAGAAEYRIYRAATVSGTLTRIAGSTTITATTYTDTGLTNGTAYRYTVRAFNNAGESPDSTEVTATPAVPATLPAAPANFRGNTGALAALLSWDAVAGATEYRVYRAATTGGTRTRIAADTTITDTAYTDTGLTNGTSYRYTVRAVNDVGEGNDSFPLSLSPDDHGNIAAGATPVTSGTAVTGRLEVNFDHDYFSIDITASPSNRVEIAATTTGSTNTVGTIYNSSGVAIVSDDDSGVDSNFRAATILQESGTYYVRVSGFLASTGAYSLTVTATATTATNDDDHGNSANGATSVTSGVAVPGSIELSGDHDYFSITVTASTSDPVTITATTTGTTDTLGTIFSSSGTQLAQHDDISASTNLNIRNLNFRVSTMVTESGTYYIRVSAYQVNTGDYSLTVTAE